MTVHTVHAFSQLVNIIFLFKITCVWIIQKEDIILTDNQQFKLDFSSATI